MQTKEANTFNVELDLKDKQNLLEILETMKINVQQYIRSIKRLT